MQELDESIGCNHLARLMRENGLLDRLPCRFRVISESAHVLPVADNLLAYGPNKPHLPAAALP